MITVTSNSASTKSSQCLTEPHSDFLPLKARVERHAHAFFRHLSAHDREEAVSEAVAAAFASFVRLKARGRNPVRDFPSRMARWAALVVMDGRHLSGTDALSQRAQRRHGFRVESLTDSKGRQVRESSLRTNRMRQPDVIEEMLRGNTQTPPCELAAFHIDFEDWLAARSHRDRRMILELCLGERTSDLALKFGITPGRVSQKRRQFHDAWLEFQGEQQVDVNTSVA